MPVGDRILAAHWTAFELRTDNKERCFEALCRALVRLAYGGYGEFVAYRQQAGVEFYLTLSRDVGALGKSGDCIGWQCKYFRKKDKLSANQKEQVYESYQRTCENYPNVGRWILWTPEALPKAGQKDILDFRKKGDPIKCLDFWDGDMVDALMATIPRSHLAASFFGQYALSNGDLLSGVRESLVPVRHRWLEDVHCVSFAEEEIRRFLFCPEVWNDFFSFVAEQNRLYRILPNDALAAGIQKEVKRWLQFLDGVQKDIETGLVIDNVGLYDKDDFRGLRRLLRVRAATSRKRMERFAPTLQNLAGGITASRNVWIRRIQETMSCVIKGVRSLPGLGKTHLAVSVALGEGDDRARPGCLILAKDLSAGVLINELASKIDIAGRHFENIDALLEALDFAGRKDGRLIPLVIDGLNESERPQVWADILAQLKQKLLARYPYVRVVVTYRSTDKFGWHVWNHGGDADYELMCLPAECRDDVVEIDADDNSDMVKRYFDAYKIRYAGAYFPLLLYHPLLLRIFCEMSQKEGCEVQVQNPTADFVGLYEGWLGRVVDKIQGDAYLSARYTRENCRQAIATFARLLWKHNARRVSADELDQALGCPNVEWKCRWSHILADEGVAMRFHSNGEGGGAQLECLHDDLAGFLIARHVVLGMGNPDAAMHVEFEEKIANRRHPLVQDIVKSLVLITDWSIDGGDIAKLVQKLPDDALLEPCLMLKADRGNEALDCRILRVMRRDREACMHFFSIVVFNATWGDGRYNGIYLDKILSGMKMGERDSVWGMWIYNNRQKVYQYVVRISRAVQSFQDDKTVRSLLLLAKWLTASVVEDVRDGAVRLACLLGERCPQALFAVAEGALKQDDPVVSEKMLAAGYGVAVAHANMRFKRLGRDCVEDFAQAIRKTVFGSRSKHATSNIGILDYAVNLIQLVDPVRAVSFRVVRSPFRPISKIVANARGMAQSAYHSEWDLVNKDIPHLWGDADYQTDTEKYKRVKLQMDQRIIDLGYRSELFQQVDDEISGFSHRRFSIGKDNLTLHRFGRKYARIALYEMKGVQSRFIKPWSRWHEIEVDPSFPNKPEPLPFALPEPFADAGRNLCDWVRRGRLPDYSSLITGALFSDDSSKWVLTEGVVDVADTNGRNALVMFAGFAVPKLAMRYIECGGEICPTHAADYYYAFHGESGWSRQWWGDEHWDGRRPPVLKPWMEVVADSPDFPQVQAERLARRLTRESYHSVLNQGECGYMLSPSLINRMNLKIIPHEWAYADGNGKVAARYFQAKEGDQYGLMFVRRDILDSYCRKRKMKYIVHQYSERTIDYRFHKEAESAYKGLPRGANEETKVVVLF